MYFLVVEGGGVEGGGGQWFNRETEHNQFLSPKRGKSLFKVWGIEY